MFITAIIWKLFLFVLKNCIHCVKKRQRCTTLISCWCQFLFPKQKHWRKSGISLFGVFFFCSVQAAHTNGSCRGCFLDWTIFPLFNYVFIALRFTPEEIGNTWLLTAAARKVFHNTFSIHKLQFVLISASSSKEVSLSLASLPLVLCVILRCHNWYIWQSCWSFLL